MQKLDKPNQLRLFKDFIELKYLDGINLLLKQKPDFTISELEGFEKILPKIKDAKFEQYAAQKINILKLKATKASTIKDVQNADEDTLFNSYAELLKANKDKINSKNNKTNAYFGKEFALFSKQVTQRVLKENNFEFLRKINNECPDNIFLYKGHHYSAQQLAFYFANRKQLNQLNLDKTQINQVGNNQFNYLQMALANQNIEGIEFLINNDFDFYNTIYTRQSFQQHESGKDVHSHCTFNVLREGLKVTEHYVSVGDTGQQVKDTAKFHSYSRYLTVKYTFRKGSYEPMDLKNATNKGVVLGKIYGIEAQSDKIDFIHSQEHILKRFLSHLHDIVVIDYKKGGPEIGIQRNNTVSNFLNGIFQGGGANLLLVKTKAQPFYKTTMDCGMDFDNYDDYNEKLVFACEALYEKAVLEQKKMGTKFAPIKTL